MSLTARQVVRKNVPYNSSSSILFITIVPIRITPQGTILRQTASLSLPITELIFSAKNSVDE